jgi:hypothetical protein
VSDEISKANQLCVACGMCCDATMFAKARIDETEKDKVASYGLTIVEVNGQFSFEQPCRYFCNNKCSIYLQRPAVICSSFKCELLKKLNKDDISLEAALEKVTMVRALQTALGKVMPNAKHSPITSLDVSAMAETIDQNDPMQRKQHAIFLMLGTKFIGLLTDHFWRKVKKTESVEIIASDILKNPNHNM